MDRWAADQNRAGVSIIIMAVLVVVTTDGDIVDGSTMVIIMKCYSFGVSGRVFAEKTLEVLVNCKSSILQPELYTTGRFYGN
ncbi:unnamed protein product [Lota lota]